LPPTVPAGLRIEVEDAPVVIEVLEKVEPRSGIELMMPLR
jgi:hypothetical protein